MSVFKGHDDLSLNRYYYSFYSFSQDDPNTIKSFVYDQNQTLVSSKDISFNSRNISDMLSFLENSQSNPYALGKSNDEFLNMDIAFAGLYKKALTETQQQSLMTYINKTYKNVYSNIITTYKVKVVSTTTTNLEDFNVLNFGGLDQNGFATILSDNGFDSDYSVDHFNYNGGFTLPGFDNAPELIDVSYGSAISFLWFTTKVAYIQKTYTTEDISENTVIQIYYGKDPNADPVYVYHKTSSQSGFTQIDSTQDTYKHFVYTINPGDTIRIEEEYSAVLLYAIVLSKQTTVNSIKYLIDDVEQPNLEALLTGNYIFDQSDPSNDGHLLKFRSLGDSTPYTTNVIHQGTPGTPDSYTLIDVTQSTPDLEYYCQVHTESMYGEFKTPTDLPYYTVKVETNIVGDSVFAIQSPGQSAYVLQPDLSFNIGDVAYFYVGDDSMTDISLVFAPTVDDTANVVGSPYYVKMGDIIRLDLTSGYTGDPLVYFEDSSAGMGYAPASSFHQTPTTDVPVSRQPYSNPSRSFRVLTYNYVSSVNTTFALENTQLILDFINEHYDGNTLTVGSETASTFKESQRLYYMYNDTIYYMFLMWFDAPWIPPDPSDNYYSVISENNTELEANYPEAWGPRDYWLSDYGTGSGTSTGPGERHDYGTNVGNEKPYNRVDYANIGIPTGDNITDNITVYYGDPLIPLSNVEYTITVVSGVFHIDGSPTPTLSLINGLNYVFDQSDDSNANNTLVIGTAPDISSSIVSSGLTIMGTPGQPGAYTHYVADGSTVYYFSYQTENMGEEPPMYTVKVVDHEVTGEKVFSFKAPGGTFINQPDLSFGAGDRYQFDVRDDTMADISLVFGTTVDDINTRNESVVSRYEGMILLDISAGYDGDRLVYFEDSSAGMGYVSSGGADTNIEPTVLWYNFDISNGNTIANDATGSSLGDAIMTRSSIVTDVSKTGTGSLLCVRDSGQTQYVTLPSLTLPSDFTMCFWHKITQDSGFTGNIYLLYFMGVNTSAQYTDQYAIEIEVNYGNFEIILNHTAGETRYTYGTYPNDNEWHHLMFIKSSTESTFKVYIDNSEKPPDKTVNMGAFSSSTYNSHYMSGRFDLLNDTANYHMGGHTDDYRFYNKALDDTERDTVYNYAPTQIATYTVDVSNNSIFRLDSGDGNGFDEKPAIDFANNTGNTYIFDQSHESNANNTLVIGTVPDVSSSIVSSGLTIMGTPGQPGAYTHYVSDGSPVYYFSYQTENMGEEPPMYTVKVVDHEITGEKVFSFKAPGTSTFINQPDLSFGAGDRYQFDVRDDTMADISLVFGTTVDDISTRNESVVSRYEGMILLDIGAGYDGDRLVYFEDTSAGMGYVSSSGGSGSGSGSDAVINISFDTDGTNSGSSGSSGDMTITHDTIDTTNTKYGNGALYINSSASGYTRSYIPTVFSSIPQNWCISLWMKSSAFTAANHAICEMYTNGIQLYLGFNTASIFFSFSFKNDNSGQYILFDLPDGLDAFDNVYHHYFFKFEGQTLTTYIDGQIPSTSIDGITITSITFERTLQGTTLTDFIIGEIQTTNNSTTYYDDVRIFDKIVSIEEAKKEVIISSTVPYTVDVSNNSIFRLDSGDGNGFVEKYPVTFNDNTTYIFDQSHESNANNTLVIGTDFDDPTSIVSYGLTIMGTPGQPGAYTKYVSNGSTVHYFSYQTPNMGYNPTP